ncbi:hypothetical protein B0H12DRAFT_687745 [Mycena haematopus]|nr:hypothetical protein B0H12DRAFT_687745 [Mycena haematopus]
MPLPVFLTNATSIDDSLIRIPAFPSISMSLNLCSVRASYWWSASLQPRPASSFSSLRSVFWFRPYCSPAAILRLLPGGFPRTSHSILSACMHVRKPRLRGVHTRVMNSFMHLFLQTPRRPFDSGPSYLTVLGFLRFTLVFFLCSSFHLFAAFANSGRTRCMNFKETPITPEKEKFQRD